MQYREFKNLKLSRLGFGAMRLPVIDGDDAKVDIPHLIELYNEHILTTKAGLFGFIAPMALAAIPQDKQPAACLHCGSCEQVCPQQIHISDVMEDFVKVLSNKTDE